MQRASYTRILPLLRDYTKDNLTGGSLHIVLDDGNIDDSDLAFCVQYAKDNQDPRGVELAEALLAMSRQQRKKVRQHFSQFQDEVLEEDLCHSSMD